MIYHILDLPTLKVSRYRWLGAVILIHIIQLSGGMIKNKYPFNIYDIVIFVIDRRHKFANN